MTPTHPTKSQSWVSQKVQLKKTFVGSNRQFYLFLVCEKSAIGERVSYSCLLSGSLHEILDNHAIDSNFKESKSSVCSVLTEQQCAFKAGESEIVATHYYISGWWCDRVIILKC